MQKPIRRRARWNIGELTGAEAAMDAGADVSPLFHAQDHYDAAARKVRLTFETGTGRKFRDIVHALHEAMHARQFESRSAAVVLYGASGYSAMVWCACLAIGAWQAIIYNGWGVVWSGVGMLLASALKMGGVLALEVQAWDMVRAELARNWVVTYDQLTEMDGIASEGVSSYVRWALRRP